MKISFRLLGISLLFVLVACGDKQDGDGSNIKEDFLPVEQAFKFSSQQIDSNSVKLSWKIADGYHLYKNKFEFSLEPESARIADVQMPQGTMLDDQIFGRQEAYKHQVEITLKLKSESSTDALKLVTKYQGCSEKGLCYPPEKRVINIKL